MNFRIGCAIAGLLLVACNNDDSPADQSTPPPIQPAQTVDLNDLAHQYLVLELSMGKHDAAHVDAYFGPESIQREADATEMSLEDIHANALSLAKVLQNWPADTSDSSRATRIENLTSRLTALTTRIEMNQGKTLSFDDESRRLFGVAAPDHDTAHFEAILKDIETLMPGDESLTKRVNEFRDQFVIPPDRLDAVFSAAIAECRRRTLSKIDLPENESFTLEYVTDKPWSGYNWYQGNAQSLIQINTELPIYISRAVDLGCHEGYPGHHTFNALLEKNLVIDKGWVEFSLYPLFSPQSLIAEGSGNYGIELAFPNAERIEFEKEVLFPLAGLDPDGADRYYALLKLLARLEYAGNEAARDYLNGTINAEQSAQWLVDYSLSSADRAAQRVKFFDTYRSYVINYNLGKDMVREYIERDTTDASSRWEKFEYLLSTPIAPVDLQ